MYNVHGLLPLYRHFCSLIEDHADYLANHTNTDWSFPTEIGHWINDIEATDSFSTVFRYPVTKDRAKDKENPFSGKIAMMFCFQNGDRQEANQNAVDA
jgi:hypothetical protein